MSVQVIVDLPEEIYSTTWRTAEQFVKKMRLAAAVKWYEIGEVSQAKAAQISGISPVEFLEALEEFEFSPLN